MQLVKDKIATIPTIKSEIVDITPGMAESWMEKNIRNRKLKRATIDAYARDMMAGNWKLTGDAIRFSPSGRLIDGQHRLLACMKADMPFRSFVLYGVADDAQNVIDTNVGRSAADILGLAGHRYAVRMAPALRLLRDIENGSTTPFNTTGSRRSTNAEIMDVIARHPHFVASVALVDYAKPQGSHPTTLIVLHYIATHFLDQPEEAGNFVNVFKSGVPRYTGDAAHATRERLLRAKHERTRLSSSDQSMLMIQAWNNFHARRQVSQVKIPNSVTIMGLDRNKLRKGKQ